MIYDLTIMKTGGFNKTDVENIVSRVAKFAVKMPSLNNDNSVWLQVDNIDIKDNFELFTYIAESSINNVLILRVQEKETMSICVEFYYENGQMMAHREIEKNKEGTAFVYKPFYVNGMDVHKFEAGI